MRFNNKVAIVTGGGSGFGEQICKNLASEGCMVIINDLRTEGGERVQNEIIDSGGKASFVQGDVSKDADWRQLVADSLRIYEKLDIVVNNAGFTHRNKPMSEVDEDTFDRIYAVNVKSLYLASKHAVPVLERNGGGVMVTVASTAGIRPRPGLTWYNGSKGAAIMTSRSLAVELAPKKIRVNVVNPVMGVTGMLEDFMGVTDTPENRERFISTIPLGRLAEPKDVASAVLYFASDEAEFLTGACLEVDGGRTI